MPKKIVKLTLRFETDDGKTLERIIKGEANKISYIMDEAGLFDDKLEEFLGCQCNHIKE